VASFVESWTLRNSVNAALSPVAAAISSPATSFGISASASQRLMIES
jgi:hypothetical protein